MRVAFNIAFISLFATIISSCRDCACIRADLYFGLIGFNDPDVDSIIIRRFDKNSNYNILKDTLPFLNTVFVRRGDTLLFSYFPETARFKSDFEYEIFLPGAGKLIRISEINEIFSEQRCNGPLAREKVDCVNEITSYKINGQSAQPTDNHIIYLRQ